MSKKVWSTYVQKPVTAEVWVIFILSLQQMLYVVSVHIGTTYNSSGHEKCILFQKFPVLFESPNRHSLLIAATPLCYCPGLNTPEF
jgi:hypothetical protein